MSCATSSSYINWKWKQKHRKLKKWLRKKRNLNRPTRFLASARIRSLRLKCVRKFYLFPFFGIRPKIQIVLCTIYRKINVHKLVYLSYAHALKCFKLVGICTIQMVLEAGKCRRKKQTRDGKDGQIDTRNVLCRSWPRVKKRSLLGPWKWPPHIIEIWGQNGVGSHFHF